MDGERLHSALSDDELRERIQGIIGRAITLVDATDIPEPECAACSDTGWTVRIDNRAYQCENCGYWPKMRQRHLDRIFSHAAIPEHFAVARFDANAVFNPTVDKLVTWATNLPGMPKRSVLLYGSFGTGKTWLAIQLLRAVVERFTWDALFITTPTLLDRIRETYSGRPGDSEAEVLQLVKDVRLLVLDDLGAERVTDWVSEKLFTIINHRHDHRLATIFTSNLSPEQLAEHLGERAAWRIVEMADCVRIDGPNLRKRPAVEQSEP